MPVIKIMVKSPDKARIPQFSAVLQTIAKLDPENNQNVITYLANSIPTDFEAACDDSSSKLIEEIINLGIEGPIHKIYDNMFKNNALKAAINSVANIVLQRWLEHCNKEMFADVCKELAPNIAMLINDHPEVFVALCNSAARLSTGQEIIIAEINKFKGGENLITTLLSTRKEMCGAQVLQAICRFQQKPADAIISAFLELPKDKLQSICVSKTGTHVVTEYLRSDLKNSAKRKLVDHLIPILPEIAADRAGSYIVEDAFKFSDMKKKVAICNELTSHPETKTNAPNVWRILKLDSFLSCFEQWEHEMITTANEENAMNDIIEDKPAKPSSLQEKIGKNERKTTKGKVIEDKDDYTEEKPCIEEGRNSSSLFLRAGTSTKNDDDDEKRNFSVGKSENGKHLRQCGPFAIVADPTYDLTFQAIFSDGKDGKTRMKSLLNSLLYPQCNPNNSNDEMVREVEFVKSSFEKIVPKEEGKQDASGAEANFKQFRCDIVCKCHIGTKSRNTSSYIDIEMQRKPLPQREKEFLEYAKELGKRYQSKNPVKVLAFLKYPIYGESDDIAKEMALGAVVKDGKGGIKLEKKEERNLNFSIMISLPNAVTAIKEGKSIKIQEDGKELEISGKEWLNLLGVSCWATHTPGAKTGYYYVPTDIYCKEVRNAIEFVRQGQINDDLYQQQLDDFFSGEKTARMIKEETENEMLLSLLAYKFYKKKKLGKDNIAIAKKKCFSFCESDAKEAIEAVGGTNEKASEFISALKEASLIWSL